MMKISIVVLLVALAQAAAIRGTDFGHVSTESLLSVGLQEEMEHALDQANPESATVSAVQEADVAKFEEEQAAANAKAAQNAEDTKEINAGVLQSNQECSEECATKAATDKIRLETEKGVEGEARNAEAEAKKTEDDVKALTALLKQAGAIIEMIPAKREKLNSLKNKLKLKDLYAESKSAEVVLARKEMHLDKVLAKLEDLDLEVKALTAQKEQLIQGIEGIRKLIDMKNNGKAFTQNELDAYALQGYGNGDKQMKFGGEDGAMQGWNSYLADGSKSVIGDKMTGSKGQPLLWVEYQEGDKTDRTLVTECVWEVAPLASAA